jgi:hypothetical protein
MAATPVQSPEAQFKIARTGPGRQPAEHSSSAATLTQIKIECGEYVFHVLQ